MNGILKKYNFATALLILIAMPLFFWSMSDVPRRTVLKESISVLTILAFFLMLGQFYLARSNGTVKVHKMSRVVKKHKIIGYIVVSVLLLHPFLIVVPRYFESGIQPVDAFITMLTNLDSLGILLGICTWCLMLFLGLTAILRNKIGINYKSWRTFHGVFSVIFIILASWHAIDLGRHTDPAMSIYIILVALVGVLLLIKMYFTATKKLDE